MLKQHLKYLITVFLIILLLVNLSCQKRPRTLSFSDWEQVAKRLDFPEGPAWDGNRALYISNCYGGWIARVIDAEMDTFVTATCADIEKTNGLAFYDDALYACDYGHGAILKISAEKQVSVYADSYRGKPFNRPNDLAFDTQGNLFFTDPSSYGPDRLDGQLFYINRETRMVTLIADSLAFPNGIAFSPKDKKLYVCESARERVIRYRVAPGGRLMDKEIFIELSGGDPDGIAFDMLGNLYVAHFGKGELVVVAPDGRISHHLKTPGNKPTNVEFGGADMRTLFLTEVETNSLYKLRLNVAGSPLPPKL